MRHIRNYSFIQSVLVCVAVASSLAACAEQTKVQSFVQKHCFECHDSDVKKGGLNLEAVSYTLQNEDTFQSWVRIYDRVRSGEMPPPKHSTLPAEARKGFENELFQNLSLASLEKRKTSGRSSARRLTRAEYENTIQDLFSMPGLAIKDKLPEDERVHGNDKSSESLNISKVLMQKYMECADFILDRAIAHQDKPMTFKYRVRRISGPSEFGYLYVPLNDKKMDMELITKLRPTGKENSLLGHKERMEILEASQSIGLLTSSNVLFYSNVGDFSPFHSGMYRIRISTWSFNTNKGQVEESGKIHSLALHANDRLLTYFDAPSFTPLEQEVVVWLNAAEVLKLNPSSLWSQLAFPAQYVGPGVAVDWVDIEGPLVDTWPPASHRRLFADLPLASIPHKAPAPEQPVPPTRFPGARPNHVDGKEFQKYQPIWTVATTNPLMDAEKLLKDFLPRAFRRPVDEKELKLYLDIVKNKLNAGDFFEIAMRTAYKTALCSPDFLYLAEPVANNAKDQELNSYAIASRLSYMLWNSMPDEALMKAAASNKFSPPEMHGHVIRMLADPKSDRFIASFLDQWMDLRKIDSTSPDGALYPEYRTDLRDAMLAETRAYFRELLDKDLGIKHVVDSDFLTINQRMAEHYGIQGVAGNKIRRVERPKDSPRGGFITQASVLKVTANGTTTSPVLRGAWFVDRILGKPPKPPPPNTAAVDPDLRGKVTIREQLNAHRNDERCASCHKNMDPPGFALENFDVIGGWRTRYRNSGDLGELPARENFVDIPNVRELKSFRYGLPVDASGETTDGKKFQDIFEFKKVVLANQQDMARSFLERLIFYSTGTAVDFTDRETVNKILGNCRDGGFKLRTLIYRVVESPIFLRK